MGIASQETRERALAAYEAGGATLGYIAQIFQIHRITLYRWIRAYRDNGRTVPLPSGNRRAVYEGPVAKRLDDYVQKHPDATLVELRDATGKNCSIMAVHRALDRLGWRYKKSHYMRVNKTDQM
jgi:transposase|tara:strand:- start:580 stop:951 length:372 start_codon:yes stop_codon:yes gene_type:complete